MPAQDIGPTWGDWADAAFGAESDTKSSVISRTDSERRCSTSVWGAPESDGADYIMFPSLDRALAQFKVGLSRPSHTQVEQRQIEGDAGGYLPPHPSPLQGIAVRKAL